MEKCKEKLIDFKPKNTKSEGITLHIFFYYCDVSCSFLKNYTTCYKTPCILYRYYYS